MKSKIVLFIFVSCFFVSCTFSLKKDNQKISELEKAVVALCISRPDTRTIKGTGVIVTPAGVIVTADHVITDDQGRVFDKIFALRPNYPEVEPLQLKVIKRFREGIKGRDIAVLKIIPTSVSANWPYIPIGEKAEAGDSVLVVGFPLVFDKVYSWPLFRSGIVASTRYNYEDSSILALDLGAVKGFSGSPVISLRTRKVVAIFKGYNSDNPQTDFSLATKLETNDIQSAE